MADNCCSKVCEILNRRIDESKKFIDNLYKMYESEKVQRMHSYIGIGYQKNMLIQLKRDLEYHNICKCDEITNEN